FNKILAAFKSGDLDEQELNRRVLKILKAKYKAGLGSSKNIEQENLIMDLHNSESRAVKLDLFKDAVTVVRSKSRQIPLRQLDTLAIGSVAVSASDDNTFPQELNKFTKVVNYKMAIKPSSSKDWQYIVD